MGVYRKFLLFLQFELVALMLASCGANEGAEDSTRGSTRRALTASAIDVNPTVDEVSFSRDVQPIFNMRCTRCHNGDLLRGGLDLTAGVAYRNLVNPDGTGVPASQACRDAVFGALRVDPGCPPTSQLTLKTRPATIEELRCRGVMPSGTPGLGVDHPDEYRLIEDWVWQGAHDN